MSRRTGIVGLVVSSVLAVLTLVVITGVGPHLPGPHIRSWLGIGSPESPTPCTFDPAKVEHPPGRPGPGSWRNEPPAPVSSPEEGATRVGKYIYLVGGQTTEGSEHTIVRFDPRTRTYKTVGELPVAIDHPTVTTHGEDVVVAGGFVDGVYATEDAWTFTPRTGEVHELASMHFPRAAAAAAVIGEHLYIAGGLSQFGNQYEPRHSMEIYDFKTGEWAIGPDMPTARHHFGAAAIAGKIYFVGGREPQSLALDVNEEYDPATEEWRQRAPLPVGSGSLSVAAADGKMIAVGGGEDGLQIGEGKWVLRTTYSYDPKTNEWTRLADMNRPRHGSAAAVINDRVYVFRGIPCPDYGHMASVESLELH